MKGSALATVDGIHCSACECWSCGWIDELGLVRYSQRGRPMYISVTEMRTTARQWKCRHCGQTGTALFQIPPG